MGRYIWIVSHAESRKELALLSVNSFQKDSVDSRSALVRAASIRSMAAIRVLEMIQVRSLMMGRCCTGV